MAGCATYMAIGFHARADAPPGRFAAPGDGTVHDAATGLVWQQEFSPTARTQPMAVSYCLSLTTAGGGWRLPTVLELSSIVDETRSDPQIDLVPFPDTPSEPFWSATPQYGSPTNGWLIGFNDTMLNNIVAVVNTSTGRARCVR